MDQRPKVYRAMYEHDGQPATEGSPFQPGSNFFQLGVVLPPDPRADVNLEDGYVNTKSGGMSVFAAIKKLPGRLIPSRLRDLYPDHFQKARGDDSLFVWCMGSGEFQDGAVTDHLVLRLDKPGEKRHGLIEPNVRMKIEDYQAELQSTVGDWKVCEEPG